MANQDHVAALLRGDTRFFDAHGIAEYDFSQTDFSSPASRLAAFPEGINFSTSANFEGCIFPSAFNLRLTARGQSARFDGCTFKGSVVIDYAGRAIALRNCEFHGEVNCTGISSELADFSGSEFDRAVHIRLGGGTHPKLCLRGSKFSESSQFVGAANALDAQDAKFFNIARFELRVHETAEFSRSRFEGGAHFVRSIFDADMVAKDATFAEDVHLKNVMFGGAVVINRAVFRGRCNLATSREDRQGLGRFLCNGSRFCGEFSVENRIFNTTTSFRDAYFESPPNFHEATFHQDTSFDGATFAESCIRSEGSERAFRTLKLAMNKAQAHAEELVFFALEMQSRTARERSRRDPVWLLYRTYEVCSSFGRSIARPAIGLIFAIALGMLALALISDGREMIECTRHSANCHFAWDRAQSVLALSVAQSLPFVPVLREAAADAYDVLLPVNGLARSTYVVIATLQSIASLAFIFLIGLGLRNLFRLR